MPKEVKTIFYVDGHKSYEDLEAFGELRAVDHQKGYSVDGASSNLAESSFSRARRGEVGSYHHWSPTYLDFYAGEMCWRENHRHVNNWRMMMDMVAATMRHPISTVLKGYYQTWLLPEALQQRPELRWRPVFEQVYGGQALRGLRLIA